jgi:hypothetical protein
VRWRLSSASRLFAFLHARGDVRPRARGIPTFGTTDLITAAELPTDQATQMIRRLGAENIVDLPLNIDDLTFLESGGAWHGAGLLGYYSTSVAASGGNASTLRASTPGVR